MKKNVVFVTWLGVYNWGTCLQAYALHAKLKTIGYNPIFAVQPEPLSIKKSIRDLLKRLLLRLFPFMKKKYFFSDRYAKAVDFQHRYNLYTINNYIQLYKLLNKADVFISGSDQIWNTVAVGYDPFMFLEFAKKRKKISYATSIGANTIDYKFAERIKRQLQQYSHISLREKTGVDVVRELTKRNDIVQVLDPTFLLKYNEWLYFAEDAGEDYKIEGKYILCYFIGKRKELYVKQLNALRKSVDIDKVIIVPSQEFSDIFIDDCEVLECATPVEFVCLLSNASLIVTDSFHATAFSINLNKQFVNFLRFDDDDPESQNSRLYDMLDFFDLRNRVFRDSVVFNYSNIDYSMINEKLEAERKRSEKFLINSIEN